MISIFPRSKFSQPSRIINDGALDGAFVTITRTTMEIKNVCVVKFYFSVLALANLYLNITQKLKDQIVMNEPLDVQ